MTHMRGAAVYLAHLIGVHRMVVIIDDGDRVITKCRHCDTTTYAASPSWVEPQHITEDLQRRQTALTM